MARPRRVAATAAVAFAGTLALPAIAALWWALAAVVTAVVVVLAARNVSRAAGAARGR